MKMKRGRLAFELLFPIVFYIINKVVLVINLDDSLYFHHVIYILNYIKFIII